MPYPHSYTRITSPFGYRHHPKTGAWSLHTGTDTVGPDEIRPYSFGVVLPTKYSEAWGNNILIRHSERVVTFSAHFEKMFVKAGDIVGENDVIGIQGATGWATGKHLHFGIQVDGKWVDPIQYIEQQMAIPEIIKPLVVEQGDKEFRGWLVKVVNETLAIGELRKFAEHNKHLVLPKIEEGRVVLTPSEYEQTLKQLKSRIEEVIR